MSGGRLLAVGFLLCSGVVFVYLLVGATLVRLSVGLMKRLAGRGETSGVPKEPLPNEPLTRDEAINVVLVADKAKVRRELAGMVAADPELRDMRGLPAQIAGYYVREADR